METPRVEAAPGLTSVDKDQCMIRPCIGFLHQGRRGTCDKDRKVDMQLVPVLGSRGTAWGLLMCILKVLPSQVCAWEMVCDMGRPLVVWASFKNA